MTRIIRVLLSLFLLLSLMLSMVSCYDGEKYTSDIADYNTEKYPIYSPFPESIPENAEVVKFAWYNNWYERQDIYLELRFDSEDALLDFLNERITTVSNELTADKKYRPADGNWFFTTENPYDDSFVDCFDKDAYVWSGDERYVGYEVVKRNENYWYDCHYKMISYSLSSRTLIITYARGDFLDGFNKTPVYFERFSVPKEPVNRLIPVEFIFPEN